ncbi:hypothetical protein DXG01_016740 [Tephrocybe rancida]|nr:hypothetical protein DXG01_016740 [Tephrocybe rancida]
MSHMFWNTAPKHPTLKQAALKQVALKAGHGLPTPAAKAPHPVPHALPKPPQQRLKQGKDGPPPPPMDINKVPCKRCVKSKKTCYIRIGKDGREGACYACNAQKVSCNLALKGKGKVQEQPGAPSNKATHKGKGKVVSPAYVEDTEEEDKEEEQDKEEQDEQDEDKEDEDEVEVVEVALVCNIIPLDPQPALRRPSALAARSSGDQRRPAPRHSAPRAATLGPSNDPLLRTALSPMQCWVSSATPPPSGGVQPNQGWYQQMVDYIAEVNAQNCDEQGRLDGLIKGLGKHAHGDGIREDMN